MAAITTSFGSGGANLAPGGAGGTPSLATALRDIATDLAAVVTTTAVSANALSANGTSDVSATAAADCAVTAVADADQANGIMNGLIVGTPTTPSAQAPGVGNTTWNVNVSAGYSYIAAVGGAESAQNDFAVHSGSMLLTNGQSCLAWVVERNVGGNLTTIAVVGTPAATGAQVAPNDAAITAAATTANWVKLGLCLLNRTGDATVTQSQDISVRQMFGWGGAPLANDLKAKYNVAVTLINELKNDLGEARALANALKSNYNTAVTLINQLRVAARAVQAVSLLTTAP